MKNRKRLFVFLTLVVALVFVSCQSAEEKRLLQIGNDVLSASFSGAISDSLSPMDSSFTTDPKKFGDIKGLAPFIFQRIKEKAVAGKTKISVDHKFSEKGLRLYILTLTGPSQSTGGSFNMTITCNYQDGEFLVMSVSGGV